MGDGGDELFCLQHEGAAPVEVESVMNHAQNPTGVADLGLTVSDPPTMAEVQALVAKLNELMGRCGGSREDSEMTDDEAERGPWQGSASRIRTPGAFQPTADFEHAGG